MRVRFMFHKTVFLVCFVAFISVCFVPEGYSQTRTQQSVSLEEQKEGRTLLVTATNTIWTFALWTGNSAVT